MPKGEFSNASWTYGNKRPLVSVWKHEFLFDLLCAADKSAGLDEGAARFYLRANVPNFLGGSSVYNPATTNLGSFGTRGDTTLAPLYSAQGQVQYAWENYSHGVVLKSKLKLKAYPYFQSNDIARAYDESAEPQPKLPGALADYTHFNPEAMVSIQLSTSPIPGPTVADASLASLLDAVKDGRLDRAYNTKHKWTRTTRGARSTGAYLTGYYSPHAIAEYPLTNLLDRIQDYQFVTGGNYTTNCADPVVDAYWNVYITPRSTGVQTVAGSHPLGVPVPHRVTGHITMSTMYWIGANAIANNYPWTSHFAGAARDFTQNQYVREAASAAWDAGMKRMRTK